MNLNRAETRNVIVQACVLEEHQFTELRFQQKDPDNDSSEYTISVEEKCFAVQLPPSTRIRLEIGMHRFMNKLSYAFPWYGDSVPMR